MRAGAPLSHARPEAGNFPLALAYQGQMINVFTDDTGAPWWVGREVCAVLGIKKPESSLALLDDDERGTHTVGTLGGVQSVTIINESGLYSLILRSRKPEAKAFKRWVTHEVLPAIRRTGGYGMAASPGVLARIERLEAMVGRSLGKGTAGKLPPAVVPPDIAREALRHTIEAWERGEIRGERRRDGALMMRPADVVSFLAGRDVLRAWVAAGWLRPRRTGRGRLTTEHRWRDTGRVTSGYAIAASIIDALLSATKGEVLQ